jgi:hypothetical protein
MAMRRANRKDLALLKEGLEERIGVTSRSYSSKSYNLVEPFVTGRSFTAHGMRSMTSHSTAFFSSTLKTPRMLLTVLGDFASDCV